MVTGGARWRVPPDAPAVISLRYNFVRVFADATADDPDIVLSDTGIKWRLFGGDDVPHVYCAYEVNGTRGQVGKVVRVSFAGYGPSGEPAYVFVASPPPAEPGVPVNDHRDNYNGGFSFSVFHPGTSLPQMNWAR